MPSAPDPDEFFQYLIDPGDRLSWTPVDGPIRRWRRWWDEHDFEQSLVGASARQGFVLSTAQLADHGVSRARSRWEIDKGRWTQAGRGVVAPIDVRRDVPAVAAEHVIGRRRHVLLTAAVMLNRPGDHASGRSAAIIHGLPTVAVPATPVLNARRESGMGPRRSVHLLAGTLDGWEMVEWYGRPITSIARTLVDLGRHDRLDAIMAGDAALREGCVTRADLERSLGLATRWPGVVQAREVLGLLDPRAESPLESVVRLRLHEDGFPPPELQHWIGRDRVDFYWPAFRLVLEADGRVKYTDDEMQWREKEREQRLRNSGHRVERIIWAETSGSAWTRFSDLLRSAMR